MPFASLQEAFITYTEYLDEQSTNGTSNPELLNTPPQPQHTEIDPSLAGLAINDEPTQQDPVAAFNALQTANEVRVPENQTVEAEEAEEQRPFQIAGAVNQAAEPTSNSKTPKSSFNCNSDHDCMTMINHILDCDPCADKLRRILNLGGGGGGIGLDLNSKNLSRILFYFIVALLIIAIYELLNSLFRKTFKK